MRKTLRDSRSKIAIDVHNKPATIRARTAGVCTFRQFESKRFNDMVLFYGCLAVIEKRGLRVVICELSQAYRATCRLVSVLETT